MAQLKETLRRDQKIALLKMLQQNSITEESREELAQVLGFKKSEIKLVYAGSQDEARRIYLDIAKEAEQRGLKPRNEIDWLK